MSGVLEVGAGGAGEGVHRLIDGSRSIAVYPSRAVSVSTPKDF